jgi:hypothetical protein
MYSMGPSRVLSHLRFRSHVVGAQINEEASEKVLEVEQRYNVQRRPVYDQRSAMIADIPEFWAKAFAQHSYFVDVLCDADLEALAFLKEVSRLRGIKGV